MVAYRVSRIAYRVSWIFILTAWLPDSLKSGHGYTRVSRISTDEICTIRAHPCPIERETSHLTLLSKGWLTSGLAPVK